MTLRHTASHQILPLQAVGRSIRMVRTAPEDTKDWAVATPAPTKKSAAVRRTRLMETLSRRSLTRILHLTADDADDASRRSRNEASQGVRRCGDGGPWSAASKPKDGNGDAGSALASMSGRSGRRRKDEDEGRGAVSRGAVAGRRRRNASRGPTIQRGRIQLGYCLPNRHRGISVHTPTRERVTIRHSH